MINLVGIIVYRTSALRLACFHTPPTPCYVGRRTAYSSSSLLRPSIRLERPLEMAAGADPSGHPESVDNRAISPSDNDIPSTTAWEADVSSESKHLVLLLSWTSTLMVAYSTPPRLWPAVLDQRRPFSPLLVLRTPCVPGRHSCCPCWDAVRSS